jgi:DNA invertase Pin-like site-specific DNA recombinase
MRAVVYARYSSDQQREVSIEDQIRKCRQRIEREGWSLAQTYTDAAVSGASRLRPGYQKLLADARDHRFDVVVAEALDRLSRDQEDVAALFKTLAFHGITILTLAEGEISELHVGLKGTMNALFLKDLALKTHRGLEGRVRQGRSAGGRAYGYDLVRELDARGEPIRGGRNINPVEAEVVRRIFREFAAGRSPAVIARALNLEGVPGPGGRPWQGGVITGHSRRRSGILRNELYIGRLVWNRQRFVKDPTTGRRLPRVNPESEWIIEEVPSLRIVDDDLWRAVAERLGEIEGSERVRKVRASRFWERRRPGHLLTGLVRCGCCGGIVASVGMDYLACHAARKMGTCSNKRGVRRQVLEDFVLDTLKDHLMAPELVKEFIAEFTAEANRQRHVAELLHDRKRRELTDISKRYDGLIDAIADGLRTPGLKSKLEELEQGRAALEAELAAAPPPAPRLHPNLAELYKRKVAELAAALTDPGTRDEAISIIRGLIERVELHPTEDGFDIDFLGEIAAMIALPEPGVRRDIDHFRVSAKRVAGAGYHLYLLLFAPSLAQSR